MSTKGIVVYIWFANWWTDADLRTLPFVSLWNPKLKDFFFVSLNKEIEFLVYSNERLKRRCTAKKLNLMKSMWHTECELKKWSLHLLDNLSDSLIYELKKHKGTQLFEARQENSERKCGWNSIQGPCNKAHKDKTPMHGGCEPQLIAWAQV